MNIKLAFVKTFFIVALLVAVAAELQSKMTESSLLPADKSELSYEEPLFMANIYGREYTSLNGKWNAIIDLYDQGDRMEVYKNLKPSRDDEFFEYSFEGGLRLNVPSDWNSQNPELKYYEGTVWYARRFSVPEIKDERYFLYFGAVSYRSEVYLNGKFLTSHEGGFTPFSVEVTGKLKEKDNFIAVRVNNRRTKDAIPALSFDWWNYGGITRDVMLVKVPDVFIEDYFVRLSSEDNESVDIDIELSDAVSQEVSVEIPELKISARLTTSAEGRVSATLKTKGMELWSPDSPRLYDVKLSSGKDSISDRIGFRFLSVVGTSILLNGKPEFMRSVSFHEEIPQRKGRAFSHADAVMLLSEAKALGVNMVRLAHYPQNEYIVRLAEEMGIILWQEIPIWQGIDFADSDTRVKAQTMLREMILRDRNRCSVCFWGVANETKPSESRNDFLISLLNIGREMDRSRLFTAAFDLVYFNPETRHFEMDDPFTSNLDVVAVNKYMGWYHPWPVPPEEAVWDVVADKPLIVSEFGGEALFGQSGPDSQTSSWSEDYQARLYMDNIEMFNHIPNLAGVSPWVLFDFRSPYRFHPLNQEDWNRKGLVSDQGYRKKAWYIMRDYYRKIKEKYSSINK